MVKAKNNTLKLFFSYVYMRTKGFGRLIKEMGFIYGSLMLAMLYFIILIGYKIQYSWVVPIAYLLIIEQYHLHRRDIDLIKNLFDKPRLFLILEYSLISIPFILLESLKGEYLGAICILPIALILPFQSVKKVEINPIRLIFLYKGSMEYIRMFRLCWWLYLLLITISVLGAINGNIKIAKFAIVVWGIIQAFSHMIPLEKQMLLLFRDYKSLISFVCKSNIFNSVVTYIPFSLAIIIYTPIIDELTFSISALVAIILFSIIVDMLHYLITISWGTYILLFLVFIPIFFFSMFVPICHVLQIFITLIIAFLLNDKINNNETNYNKESV